MTTSGTVGLETLDVTSVIEHAARRCGVLASGLTAENQQSARENLGLILSRFVTKGLKLWCVQKTVYPLIAGRRFLTLDVGTVDVEDALMRSVTLNAGTVGAPGVTTFTPTDAVVVGSVSVQVPAGSYTFTLEGSPDGVTWTEYGRRAVTPTAAGWLAFDSDAIATLGFWRVRELNAGAVVFIAANFNTAATEIPITVLTRDDYVDMPNKEFLSTQPLQAFYDKQYVQPRLWFWPVPQDNTRLCIVWAHFQVQDVGALSNTLQVPQRWMDAVISDLAPLICLELPKELVPPDRYNVLVARAADALKEAQDAEDDGAPLRLLPMIRGYTRG